MTNGSDNQELANTYPVPALRTIDFSVEDARRYFISQRNIDGAKTPIGRRWSNLIEQTVNYYRTECEGAREHLKYAIARSVLEIRELKRGKPPTLAKSDAQLLIAFSAGA